MYAFWEIIASNAVVATVLAVGALLLGGIWKNAAAVHVLWVVVLLKLFTPPLITTELPFASTPSPSAPGADSRETALDSPARVEAERTAPVAMTNSRGAVAAGDRRRPLGNRSRETAGHTSRSLSAILAAIWTFGTCGMAAAQAIRIRRFARVLRDCEGAPPAIRAMATQLSSRLGLRRVPDVLMTSRALPPLVWSIGLFPRLILPTGLFGRLSGEAQGTILAHELCHVRRGDHLVRLLELAAATVFWWHPVVWWARRQLHELEEQCCDSRVLELVPHPPRTYAAALVETLEFLSERPRPPVPLRTAIDSTRSLSRRIHMLTQSRTNRLSALSATLVAGLVALPLAVAFAIDPEPASAGKTAPEVQPTASSPPAILRGRVTDEEGTPLADVRVRVAIPATDMRSVDASTDHEQVEAKSDAEGNYRVEFPGITSRTTVSIDAMKPGYRRLVGTHRAGGDPRRVEVEPGTVAEAALVLKPALYFAGTVVDEQGKPVPGVHVSANVGFARSSGGIETTTSLPDGSFELFCYPAEPPISRDAVGKGFVYFLHPDYISYKIENVYDFAQEQREGLLIVLGAGRKVTGTVLDAGGRPVPDVMVKAVREDRAHRKAAMTDASGKFILRGLVDGPTTFSARALEIKQKARLTLAVNGDQDGLDVRLQPMGLPAEIKTHDVLGMRLADVTPELKSAYDLFFDRGALILDPGKDSDRLKIGRPGKDSDRLKNGRLAEGYCFWMVGRTRIGGVREFVSQILAETAGKDAETYTVRVVYSYSRLESDGSSTQYLKLTKDDLKQLQTVLDQLPAASR